MGEQLDVLLIGQSTQLLQSLIKGLGEHLLLGRQSQLALFHLGSRFQPLQALGGSLLAPGEDVLPLPVHLVLGLGVDGLQLLPDILFQAVQLCLTIGLDPGRDFFNSVHSAFLSRLRR